MLVGWEALFPSAKPVPVQSNNSLITHSSSTDHSLNGKTSKLESRVGGSEDVNPRHSKQKTTKLTTRLFKLSNSVLDIEFTNQGGGGISKAELKGFFETPEKKSLYRLFHIVEATPLLQVQGLVGVSCDILHPDVEQSSKSKLSFHYRCGEQGSFSIIYVIGRQYVLDVSYDFTQLAAAENKEFWVSFPANLLDRPTRSSVNQEEFIYGHSDDQVERVSLTAEQADISVNQAVQWVAFGDRYFFVGVLSPDIFKPKINVEFKKGENWATHLVLLKYLIPHDLSRKTSLLSTQLYLGPKDQKQLSGLGTMGEVIDFGFFGFIASPIYSFLKFMYAHVVSNYGIAIIILTILVRLMFLPLTLKGMGNMQAMQRIQPELQKLKEKHKDNREKLNQEMVGLFRAHKVNPLGGCLPILIQIPVFFALYTVLMNAVDLYHAPFFGWIQDLSGKDPYYVLPALLGIAFFVQQKLTPSTVDSTTQKVMMVMPIMFTFFMLNLPAGLNLYILTSTVLGVIQQLAINRRAASIS